MNFFKKLFSRKTPEPIKQQDIDVGIWEVEVQLTDGAIYPVVFVGEYFKSEYLKSWEIWIDQKSTAESKFFAWLDWKKDYLRLRDNKIIPTSSVKSIDIKSKKPYIFQTNRKWD